MTGLATFHSLENHSESSPNVLIGKLYIHYVLSFVTHPRALHLPKNWEEFQKELSNDDEHAFHKV